ncbi:hypothetical protein G6F42_021658 [Rhizopus arrhizus]|nr:hypothetical protein G6F42_021658 [Rhizopus arrhizus]
MKFAKYLESQSVPEWRKAYISYKGLKKKLKQVERFRKHKERKAAIQLDNVFQELEDSNDSYYWPHSNLSINMRPQSIMSRLSSRFSSRHDDDDRPSSRQASFPSSTTTLSVLDQVLFHASASERHFFDSLDLELDKISRFYDEKEKESRLKLDALKASHQEASLPPPEMIGHHRLYNWFKYQDPHTQSYTLSDLSPNFDYIGNQRISYNVARNRLKKAVTEYYRSLEFLRSYKTLNETGFQKILKKFDKIAGWKASDLYTQTIKKHHWASTSDLDFIIKETENLYINEFADGHRRRGMRKLRAPEKNEVYIHYTAIVSMLTEVP